MVKKSITQFQISLFVICSLGGRVVLNTSVVFKYKNILHSVKLFYLKVYI